MKRVVTFLQTRASKQDILAQLPHIRHMTQTPNQLELTLTEGVDHLPVQGDSALRALVGQAKHAGMNYVLQARYRGATGKETAGKLAAVVNQAYQSPLYQKDEPFRGELAFPAGKGYVLAA